MKIQDVPDKGFFTTNERAGRKICWKTNPENPLAYSYVSLMYVVERSDPLHPITAFIRGAMSTGGDVCLAISDEEYLGRADAEVSLIGHDCIRALIIFYRRLLDLGTVEGE